MISIQSSLTELERTHQQRQAVIDCYITAIKNIAHYTVELDEGLTAPHRKYLTALAADVASGTAETMMESRSMLRSLLRDYRDKAAQYLLRTRDEMAGTTRSEPRAHMQNFMDCIRSGQEPNCPVELGFRVAIPCRMAVESYRQGRIMRWDPVKEEIV